MRAVVTVTGKDKKGIIARVSAFLAERGVNIKDISQTILGEYFAMIMIADLSESKEDFSALAEACAELCKQIGMSIYLQNEEIFNAIHKI